MSTFIQLHLLTSYPPSNLNRDDLGRPKTAIMGNATRLRISSQSLKRAWRKSEIFEEECKGRIGKRTKEIGLKAYRKLVEKGIDERKAKEWAVAVAGQFGKNKGTDKNNPLNELEIEQLAHFSPEEETALFALVDKLASENRAPSDDELHLLREQHTAVDIAMFGRMLASAPKFNMEAAVQVAHAVTVHEVAIEDDFFTAVDDLNEGAEDMGAAHMGETEFGAGLYYIYVCINKDLLKTNLNGDPALADNACKALVQSAATISPTGKQNSFGSRAYATYMLAEKGTQQPRSLSVAFLSPIKTKNLGEDAVAKLEEARDRITKVYGKCFDEEVKMNALTGDGSLSDILKFVEG